MAFLFLYNIMFITFCYFYFETASNFIHIKPCKTLPWQRENAFVSFLQK